MKLLFFEFFFWKILLQKRFSLKAQVRIKVHKTTVLYAAQFVAEVSPKDDWLTISVGLKLIKRDEFNGFSWCALKVLTSNCKLRIANLAAHRPVKRKSWIAFDSIGLWVRLSAVDSTWMQTILTEHHSGLKRQWVITVYRLCALSFSQTKRGTKQSAYRLLTSESKAFDSNVNSMKMESKPIRVREWKLKCNWFEMSCGKFSQTFLEWSQFDQFANFEANDAGEKYKR